MSFWPYCRLKPQANVFSQSVYLSWPTGMFAGTVPLSEQGTGYGRDYPLSTSFSGPAGNSFVRGAWNGPWVDNEQDWISFSWPYAIRSDGTLWCLKNDSIVHTIEGLPSTYGPVQVGSDTDWKSIQYGMLLKQDGSLWAIDGNVGVLGYRSSSYDFDASLYTSPSSTNPGGANFRAVISSPVESVEVMATWPSWDYSTYRRFTPIAPDFSKKPTVSLRQRSLPYMTESIWYRDRYDLPGILWGAFTYDKAKQAPTSGSGAELSCEWIARIHSVPLPSDRPSAYTSLPTITIVPKGNDTNAGVKLYCWMSSVATERFEVVSSGSGYTHATAADPLTGATASGIIENGAVVGWSITSNGSASRNLSRGSNPNNPSEQKDATAATVTGDGVGAEAKCVPFPSNLVSINVYGVVECWTEPPDVVVSGGGLEESFTIVPEIRGRVTKVRVTSQGDGYTTGGMIPLGVVATPAAGDAVGKESDIGVANLLGGPVVRVDGPPTPFWPPQTFYPPNEGSTGEVLPFEYNTYSNGDIVSAELVGAEGMTVPVSVINGTVVKLESKATGFGNAEPILRIYKKIKPSQYLSVSPYEQLFGIYGDERSHPCSSPFTYSLYAQSGIYGPSVGPYVFLEAPAVGEVTVTGSTHGSEAKYKCVDGVLLQSSRPAKSLGTRSSSEGGFGLGYYLDANTYNPYAYVFGLDSKGAVISKQLFTGAFYKEDYSIGPSNNFRLASRWVPPSRKEASVVYFPQGQSATASYSGSNFVSGVFFSRPQGATVACGVAEVAGGGYSTVAITSPGSGYKCEPPLRFFSSSRPYPERVGDLYWNSISKAGSQWIGVTKQGKAYKWQASNYNGEGTPAQVGRGARLVWDGRDYEGIIEYSQYGGTQAYRWQTYNSSGAGLQNGSNGRPPTGQSMEYGYYDYYGNHVSHGYALMWNRIIVDRPASGSNAAGGFGTGAAIRVASPYTDISVSVQGEHRAKTKVLGVVPHAVGSGYTSVPQLRFLEVDPNNPIAAGLSVELVGPETFDRVEGRFFIDTDGNAWDSLTGNVQSEVNYAAAYTRTETQGSSKYLSTSWSAKTEISTVRTLRRTNIDLVDLSKLSPAPISGTEVFVQFYPASNSVLETAQFQGCPDAYGSLRPPSEFPIKTQWTFTSTVGEKAFSTTGITASGTTTILLPSLRPNSDTPHVSLSDGVVTSLATDDMLPMVKIRSSTGIKTASSVDLFASCVALNDGRAGFYYQPNADRDYGFYGTSYSFGSNSGVLLSERCDSIDSFSGGFCRTGATKQIWKTPTIFSRKKNVGDLSLVVKSGGSGYTEPPSLIVSQKPHVADAEAFINGKVCGVAILKQGQGFLLSSPPTLTLTGGDPRVSPSPQVTHAILKAVLEGPVYDTEVTSRGSGYRCEPEVLFSKNGIPAIAGCDVSGEVDSIQVVDGGHGHKFAPQIEISGSGSGATATASICGYVESVTLSNAGVGYTASPTVTLSGGGGSGAKAIAVLAAASPGYRISQIVVTDPGSGYTSPPAVSITGGGGSGAAATSVLNASVVSVDVSSGGEGYDSSTKAAVTSGNATLAVTMSLGVDSLNLRYGGEYRRQPTVEFLPRGTIQSVSVTDGGGGYKTPPKVAILAACGEGAVAQCKISGVVQTVSVEAGGQGYEKPPLLELVGGYDPATGTPAKVRAVCSGGQVTSVEIDAPGSGYFSAPEVRVAAVAPAVLRCDTSDGKITAVHVVSGGYGYASPPAIVFTGGSGATATASVEDGVVKSVSVVAQGSGYGISATATAVSGVGTGATLAATISASVSSVSLISRGEGYEPGEPLKVIFSGGSGHGASATATIESAGGGASATARVNASIVAIKTESRGGYYQTTPQVDVDMSNNFLQAKLGDEAARPVIQVRIKGKVESVRVLRGGSNYSSTTSFDTNTTGVGGGIIRSEGRIIAVPASIFGSQEFFVRPDVVFPNKVLARSVLSCLTGVRSVSVEAAPLIGQTSSRSYPFAPYVDAGQYSIDRTKSTWHALRTAGLGPASGVVVTGKLAQIGPQYAPLFCPMATEPEITVVDANGTGGAMQMTSPSSTFQPTTFSVTSPGSGYTLGAAIQFRGGVPKSWAVPTTAKCDFNAATGKITSISIDQAGDGLFYAVRTWCAYVYVDGGGEPGGSTSPVGIISRRNGPLAFEVTDNSVFQRTFSSKPNIVVVSSEVPSHRQAVSEFYGTYHSDFAKDLIPANEYAIRRSILAIADLAPESAAPLPTSAISLDLKDFAPKPWYAGAWEIYDHYWNGWVDHAVFWYAGEEALMDLNAKPLEGQVEVYRGGAGGPNAEIVWERVQWSDVYADGMCKRQPDE